MRLQSSPAHNRLVAVALTAAVAAVSAPCGADRAPDLGDEVLEMLRAGLSEGLVVEWLEGHEGSASRPSARRLIELKEAGASEKLLGKLLAISRGADPSAPEGGRQRLEPAAGGQTEPAAPPASAGILVSFRLGYLPRSEEDEEPWDLFVYLDGLPLSWVPQSSMLGGAQPLEFRQRLAPGPHRLRVALERHEKRRRGRWRHAARFARERLDFELEPGAEAEVEVSFREGWMGLHGGPLTLRAVQEERAFELEGVGGDPERWPELCEELATRQAGGKEPPGSDGGCARWSELWAGDVPPREEVRDALAGFDFRPVPKGS